MRNEEVPKLANRLREALGPTVEVFDDWFAAGRIADDEWQAYEQGRGHSFAKALEGYASNHVFNFDWHHLIGSSHVVLLLPAGKSGHLELGWAMGGGRKGYILYPSEPERWDQMYQFARRSGGGVFRDEGKLIDVLKNERDK